MCRRVCRVRDLQRRVLVSQGIQGAPHVLRARVMGGILLVQGLDLRLELGSGHLQSLSRLVLLRELELGSQGSSETTQLRRT